MVTDGLSHFLGKENRSSHGWCLMLNCMFAGTRLVVTEVNSCLLTSPSGQMDLEVSQPEPKPSEAALLVKLWMVLSYMISRRWLT